MINRSAHIALFCLVLTGLAIVSEYVAAAEFKTDLIQQRKDFLAAREALRKGKITSFNRISRWVETYPLYGYLRYDYLSKRLHRIPDNEIREFIATYSDSPVSYRLRNKWLYSLASKKRWDTFRQEFNKNPFTAQSSVKLYCHSLQARIKNTSSVSRDKELMTEITTLWLTGKSRPKVCDVVFKKWKALGGMTQDLIWQRIRLAMKSKKITLAKFLAKSLKKEDQTWVRYWVRMHKNPASMLVSSAFSADTPVIRNILQHGVKRLARLDVEAAVTEWQGLKESHRFSEEEVAAMDRDLALRAAYRNHPRAAEWLGSLATGDDVVTPWRIRMSLASQNWDEVLSWIETLPESEINTDRWQYWRGRALEQISLEEPLTGGSVEQAQTSFTKIANHRSYYGFLAADKLNREYDFEIESVSHREHELSEVISLPSMTRSYELYRLGFTVEARREWQFGLKSMDKRQLQLAAVLASRWGWYDRAILTVAQSKHYSDLDIRFPMAFLKQVMASARRYRIDPAWVYGVVRQESAFMTDAKSSAGAMGLMQLMPRTARSTAKSLKLPMKNKFELLNADLNIRLGSGYLKQMLDRHNGNQVLATAAYNAGPHRVKKWLPTGLDMPADMWVETIPFSETRQYIKNVMAFTTIFDKRLDGKLIAMSDRMPSVPSKKQ